MAAANNSRVGLDRNCVTWERIPSGRSFMLGLAVMAWMEMRRRLLALRPDGRDGRRSEPWFVDAIVPLPVLVLMLFC